MGHGGKMNCSKCGKNISMDGSQMCKICDPDIDAIITGEVETKTPELCERCFTEHVKEHNQ